MRLSCRDLVAYLLLLIPRVVDSAFAEIDGNGRCGLSEGAEPSGHGAQGKGML